MMVTYWNNTNLDKSKELNRPSLHFLKPEQWRRDRSWQKQFGGSTGAHLKDVKRYVSHVPVRLTFNHV